MFTLSKEDRSLWEAEWRREKWNCLLSQIPPNKRWWVERWSKEFPEMTPAEQRSRIKIVVRFLKDLN